MQSVTRSSDTQLRLTAPPPAAASAASARDSITSHLQAASSRHDAADIIDVEVLWEDAGEGTPARSAVSVSSQRFAASGYTAPLRVVSANAAIAAYRSASSTAPLPHLRVDVWA
jgi:hypothetical protein